MNNKEMIKKLNANAQLIYHAMEERGLFEGLAEEAVEVAQAALKIIRATGLNSNPTDVPFLTAHDKLIEEISDLMLYMLVLNLKADGSVMLEKSERWLDRLGVREEDQEDDNFFSSLMEVYAHENHAH